MAPILGGKLQRLKLKVWERMRPLKPGDPRQSSLFDFEIPKKMTEVV